MVTIAAAFSTGSAINSTLFATARLARVVAEDGELPAALDHTNRAGMPDRAVIGLGALAAVLAAVGTLTTLVEAASLAFLFTFVVVCGLAFRARAGGRIVTAAGALGGVGGVGGTGRPDGASQSTVTGVPRLPDIVAKFARPWLLSLGSNRG